LANSDSATSDGSGSTPIAHTGFFVANAADWMGAFLPSPGFLRTPLLAKSLPFPQILSISRGVFLRRVWSNAFRKLLRWQIPDGELVRAKREKQVAVCG
jgi:hypothetical protein